MIFLECSFLFNFIMSGAIKQNNSNSTSCVDLVIRKIDMEHEKNMCGKSQDKASLQENYISGISDESYATIIQRLWKAYWKRKTSVMAIERCWYNYCDWLEKLASTIPCGEWDYCLVCGMERYVSFNYAEGKRTTCYPCIRKNGSLVKWLSHQNGKSKNPYFL